VTCEFDIKETGFDDAGWIDVVQKMDKWRTSVLTMLNIEFLIAQD
jgi:hypothetical protein